MARLCVDSDDFQVDPGTGELQIKPGATGWQQELVFTANGTFTKASYPKLSKVWVRVVGGGGGSAATPLTAVWAGQSGGGGGAYAESLIPVASLPASVPITVGAGGTAGAVSSGAGGNGGGSSFGVLVAAGGGQGSLSQLGNGGPTEAITDPTGGGIATAGQIQVAGSAGHIAVRLSNTIGFSGYGGDSKLGAGAPSPALTSSAGLPGLVYGGGASGSSNLSGAAMPGAVGAAGVVIVVLIF